MILCTMPIGKVEYRFDGRQVGAHGCGSRPRATTRCEPSWRSRRTDDGYVKAEALSDAEAIPFEYLQNILRDLRRAGLLRAQRGYDGGYQLSRPAAVDQRLRRARSGGEPADRALPRSGSVWDALETSTRDLLGSTTVADLVPRLTRRGSAKLSVVRITAKADYAVRAAAELAAAQPSGSPSRARCWPRARASRRTSSRTS